MSNLWSVAVDAPMPTALTYAAPEHLQTLLQRGMQVHVPLGKRKTTGVLLGPSVVEKKTSEASEFKIKEILDIDDQYSTLPEHFILWLEWLAKYYMHPIGRVASLTYPPLKKTDKQRKSQRPSVIPQVAATSAHAQVHNLTEEQQQVLKDIQEKKGFHAHLLFGVTGSGKTEVYLQLLQNVLQNGKQGMVLVPEISLTPQLIQRFAARFGDKVAVLHSQLTDRERTNQWWEIVQGHKQILIGARSALFCPVPNLDIIIIDEEHESSFKQDEKLKYHGRDAAIMLAKLANCPIILGSATPSLETWKNCLEKKYSLHKMTKRVENRSLPEIQIIDLRASTDEISKDEKAQFSDIPFWMSPKLFIAIRETLTRKEQVALFLNRRGIAQLVLCPSCGYTVDCPNCDISLTLHGHHHLVCHYCDYHEDLKQNCPSCKEGELKPVGLGTELIESDLARLFPGAVLARADRDEIQNRADLEDMIERMDQGEIDILIGTQMIAKGLDFPKLTLVGLVLADIGFNLPDFRSTERSFQLVTQVSGRAGRHVKPGETPGQVIIQTFNPEHPSLTFAIHNQFEAFAELELQHRAVLNYPPYGKLISCRIQGPDLGNVHEAARLLSKRGQQLKQKFQGYEQVEILGPAEAPLAKLRGQFRYYMLFKADQYQRLSNFCQQLLGDQKWLPEKTRLIVDVDPLHLL
jgi:primosomal protein N' (replication factor Y)